MAQQRLLFRRLYAISKSSYTTQSNLNRPSNRLLTTSARTIRHIQRSESTTSSKASPPPPAADQSSGVSLGAIFFTSLCLTTFGLGVWQTQRYFEKFELVDKREEDLKLPPLQFHEWLANQSNTDESDPRSSDAKIRTDKEKKVRSYRLVSVKGTFDHGHQILVGPRGPPPGALAESGPNSGRGGGGGMSSSTQGYWVLTPFIVGGGKDTSCNGTSSGKRGWFGLFNSQSKSNAEATTTTPDQTPEERIVWINRGWIPRHFMDRDLRILHQWEQPLGTVEIMTMESETETPGRFSPPSRLETKSHDNNSGAIQKLLWLDRQAISELTECPLGQNPPLFVQIRGDNEDTSSLFPVRSTREYVGEFKVTPEVHVGYAFTWFGLSGAGVLMTRKLLSRGR